jgi:hypothetical protein
MTTLTKAEMAAKKDQKAIEAQAAWQEYEAQQAAIDRNMARLRALRLAREAAQAVKPARARERRA